MKYGTGVSAGIGHSAALKYIVETPKLEKYIAADPETERERYLEAFGQVEKNLQRMKEESASRVGEENAAIFEAHLMLLQDEDSVSEPILERIESGVGAAAAVYTAFNEIYEMLTAVDDELIAQRGSDVLDLMDQVLRALLHAERPDLSKLTEKVVLVCNDLAPSDTVRMDLNYIAGIICQGGGRTSHSAILAKAMGIPAIVGCEGILDEVENGQEILMDGSTGQVILNPTPEQVEASRSVRDALEAHKRKLEAYRGKPTLTADGKQVRLCANIGSPEECRIAVENDCEGVGLFRTEFLYMDCTSLPSEERQFEAYKQVLCYAGHREVTIRTLDVGGDKELKSMQIPKEDNPFLGYRAIRICLNSPKLFKTQLRALYRASVYGNLRIMFPMIATVPELQKAKAMAAEAREELRAEGIPYREDVPLGIMIEIPSAAVISDLLAKEADFFSIGTNDLTQYTMAVDRGNPLVADLYTHFNPGVIRLIEMTIRNAREAGIECCMCGEAAADPDFIPLLLGLGLETFYMSSSGILESRMLIRGTDQSLWQQRSWELRGWSKAEDIRKYCQKTLKGASV